MGRYHSNPYGHGFALQAGLMGAIVGGLKYQLDLNTQRLAEQAEMQKEQRLAQLQQQQQMAQESRANDEWTRRNAIEDSQQSERDQRLAGLDVQKATTVDDHATANDIRKLTVGNDQTLTREQQMEALRAENARRQAAYEADQQRRTHVYDKTYDAVAAAKDPAHYGSGNGGDGVYGTDGKFYAKGTPLPPGVDPAVGFGATNLGTRGSATGGRPYVSPRSGATAPAQTGAPHPDGTRLRGPDGRIYIVRGGVPVPM